MVTDCCLKPKSVDLCSKVVSFFRFFPLVGAAFLARLARALAMAGRQPQFDLQADTSYFGRSLLQFDPISKFGQMAKFFSEVHALTQFTTVLSHQ